jgi:hypothetical protein
MLAIACMMSVMMRKYEYCLDTCSLYVSGDTYIRRKNFRWMEMGIVVKIHVPIQSIEPHVEKCAFTDIRLCYRHLYSTTDTQYCAHEVFTVAI